MKNLKNENFVELNNLQMSRLVGGGDREGATPGSEIWAIPGVSSNVSSNATPGNETWVISNVSSNVSSNGDRD
jgi:hypothetical protein